MDHFGMAGQRHYRGSAAMRNTAPCCAHGVRA